MYKIRRGSSPPQGMLIAVIILMLSVLTLNFEITTIAPQYASFGTQQYKDYENGTYTLKPCSLDAPQSNCTLTQVATFVNRISVRTNFFGILFFYATWVFLALALIGLAVAIFKAKPTNIEQRDSDSDSDEER
jgi:LMBR1 domain-containing protein 1